MRSVLMSIAARETDPYSAVDAIFNRAVAGDRADGIHDERDVTKNTTKK